VALTTPRILVCLAIVPGFGLNVMTGLAKNAAAMAFALPACLPTFLYLKKTPPDFLTGSALMFKEAMVGLMLGVMMAIPFWVVQSVGAILERQRSPIQIPESSGSARDSSGIGLLLLQAVVLMMVQAGLLLALARILVESYAAWPAYTLTPPFELDHLKELIKRFGEMFWYIVVYGGPLLIPLLMVDFAFALISVFAGNLQLSSAASGIKSILGMLLALAYWPTLSHYVSGDFARLLDIAAELLQVRK
jgi:type III secretion protein T